MIRSFEEDKVIVKWIPDVSTLSPIIVVNSHGTLIVNGQYFANLDDYNTIGARYNSSSISALAADWGNWIPFNQRVETGGLPVSIVATVICASAPWVSVRIIAGVIGSLANSDYYIISGKIRYKSDAQYTYYERYTNIINDKGTYVLKDFFDSGQEHA